MNKYLYNNNDEEYQHVIKLLKELPKEKASDNFEYNLRVKIENKNFDLNTKESRVFTRWNMLVSAATAVVASVIIFFTIFPSSDSIENPFQTQPKLRSLLNASSTQSTELVQKLSENEKISENDVVLRKEARQVKVENNLPKTATDNSVAKSDQKLNFPFENSQSTNLDEVLNSNNNATTIDRRAQLAGRSNFFNGFFIRDEVDKEYVEALRARMDSLKKAHKMKQKNVKNAE